MEDLQDKIIELMDLFDDEQVTTADKIDRPQRALDREAIDDFMKRNPMAGGGMLVQPSADGSRPGYRGLTEQEKNKLKKGLGDDYKKLKFSKEYQKNYPDRIDYGVRQRADKSLYQKVVNILNPGAQTTGVKILNRDNLRNALIKSTNAGDDLKTIVKKMNKLDNSLSQNQVSSAINSLVQRGDVKPEFGVPTDGAARYGYRVGDIERINKLIKKEVKSGKLNKIQIAKKANVSDKFVESWIIKNKGKDFHDENYNYEKGKLKTGNLQKRKDLFNYIETVDNISAKEIKKLFKMKSGKETQQLMSDLVSTIYRMTGNTRTGSLIVPYEDEGRMREVLRKIRNAPDFEDIYQRRIGDLIRQAYPKGPKRNQAIKALGEYYKFSKNLKDVAPELALSLDHVVPFQFLEEVKQGKNPMNLIKVKPIPQAVNRFKANFDSARIEINRALKINPTDKNTLNKFKILKELEQITPLEFGGVSAKGNVYDFKAKPIGQSNLIEDAIEGLRTYNRIGKFSEQVLTDETLQKKLLEAGVDTGKDFAAFKRIKPLSKAVEDKVINTIVSYSKLKKCQISLNADGGRIGFANSIECITDGLNEAKKSAAGGDQKAARQLVETAEAASKGGRLLKNVLGPGAILGEAVFEGALIGNKLLEGKPLDQAWAESYLSYLDPRKYAGLLNPTKIERERMLTRTINDETIDGPNANLLRAGFAAQDQLAAANKAVEDRDLAARAGKNIRYAPAAADAREQAARANLSANIISSDAFQEASKQAREYLDAQEGKNRFPLNQFKQSIGKFESQEAKNYRRQKEQEMKNLYAQYSDDQVRSFLKQSLGTNDDKLIDKYLELTGVTKRITPAVTTTLSGLDVLRTGDQIEQAKQRIADAGGVANLARGGRAGFKLGKLAKLKKSKVREDVKNIIDDSIKKQGEREFSPNLNLDALIKKTLDEDFFDKKDRIVDTLNFKAAKERKNFPYNQKVFEEPSQLDFYRDIKESNFRTKTGEYFDRIRRRNKAGGGLLKLAGDRSGPPPESGPNSQGLQGLLNRVKNT